MTPQHSGCSHTAPSAAVVPSAMSHPNTHSSSPRARMDPASLQHHSGITVACTETHCPPCWVGPTAHHEGVRPTAYHSGSPRGPFPAWGREGVQRGRAWWDRERERKDLPLLASAAQDREKRAVRREQRGDPGWAECGGTTMALQGQGRVETHWRRGWGMSQCVPGAKVGLCLRPWAQHTGREWALAGVGHH